VKAQLDRRGEKAPVRQKRGRKCNCASRVKVWWLKLHGSTKYDRKEEFYFEWETEKRITPNGS